MIAHHAFWHLSEASFGLIIVAMIGAIATWQGRRGRRVELKVDEALENQSTGNAKALGETVHDIAQTQEVISAQMHTNTRELLGLADQHTALVTRLEQHIEESREVHRVILDRFPDQEG